MYLDAPTSSISLLSVPIRRILTSTGRPSLYDCLTNRTKKTTHAPIVNRTNHIACKSPITLLGPNRFRPLIMSPSGINNIEIRSRNDFVNSRSRRNEMVYKGHARGLRVPQRSLPLLLLIYIKSGLFEFPWSFILYSLVPNKKTPFIWMH